MTLSRQQTAILHVAKTKLGWDDDTYRLALVRIAGVTTSKDLDQDGFAAMMGFMEHMGFRPIATGGPRYGNRPGMATFAHRHPVARGDRGCGRGDGRLGPHG